MAVLLDPPNTRTVDTPTGHPLDRFTVFLAFAAFPLALLGDVGGFNAGALGWAAVVGFGLLGVVLVPLDRDLLRTLSLFLIFLAFGVLSLLWAIDFSEGVKLLAQFSAVAVTYVAGWRWATIDNDLVSRLRRWAPWLLPASLIVFFNAAVDGSSVFGWIRGGNVARPMVMTLSILFLIGSINRSQRFALVFWTGAFLVALASGGRMGMAVLGVMLVLSPALRWTWKQRLVLVGIGLVALSVVVQFEAVQERLFLGQQEGELEDILTLEGNFNTAGRSNNWPRIVDECSPNSLFGHGAGSNAILTLQATAGATNHPHNDYLRTFCDFGLAGSAVFWGFFLAAAARAVKLFRHPKASRIESEVGAVAGLTLLALLLFAVTDNVIVYTSTFMGIAGVLVGMADGTLHRIKKERTTYESPFGTLAGGRVTR